MRTIFLIALLAVGAVMAPALADGKGKGDKGGKGKWKTDKAWVERFAGPPPWAPAHGYRSKSYEYGYVVPPPPPTQFEWRFDGYQWQYVPGYPTYPVWADEDEWDDYQRWKEDKERLKEMREREKEEFKEWRDREKELSKERWRREYEDLPPPLPNPWPR